jgi:hypothetical protein
MRHDRSDLVVLCVLTLSLLVLSAPRLSHAQCAFDAPAKAKGFKSSLVRAYASCPGVTFASPNTSTMAGVPGCAPPNASSAYEFDDATGECSVRASHKVESPCPDGSAASCSVLRIVTKCRGLLDPGGTTLTNTSGWTVNVVHRGTSNDRANGDMTIINFPAQFAAPAVANGNLKLTFEIGPCTQGICNIFGSDALSPCTQLELLSVALHDPDGNAFAKLGSSGRQ